MEVASFIQINSSPSAVKLHAKHEEINPAFSVGLNQFYNIILMPYFEQ